MKNCLIEVTNLTKSITLGTRKISILLNRLCLKVLKGEFVSIMGPSGSGKTTLLHILGCLEKPTSGTYLFNGRNIFNTSDEQLSALRATEIGIVFQNFNLIPNLNVYENVGIPFLYSITNHKKVKKKILKSLQEVGMHDRLYDYPSILSGGEMQRVAIARAMVTEPKIIFADEPTGSLDSDTEKDILALFQKFHQNKGTLVLVTHDPDVAHIATRTLTLKNGILQAKAKD